MLGLAGNTGKSLAYFCKSGRAKTLDLIGRAKMHLCWLHVGEMRQPVIRNSMGRVAERWGNETAGWVT
jgi:hypothetical protein